MLPSRPKSPDSNQRGDSPAKGSFRRRLERLRRFGRRDAAEGGSSGGASNRHDLNPAEPPGSSTAIAVSEYQSSPSREASPATLSLWVRAYRALEKEDPDLVAEYEKLLAEELQSNLGAVPRSKTNDDFFDVHDTVARQAQLVGIAERAMDRMDGKRLQLRIFGRTYVLKDQITQATVIVQRFKDLISEGMKASPEASMAWAGISCVLPLLTNAAAADEANRDGFTYVTSRMRYYTALEPLLFRLLRYSSAARTTSDSLARECEVHIVDLYQHILKFQLQSIKRFYRRWLLNIARDALQWDDWQKLLAEIKELESIVTADFKRINDFSARQELEALNQTSEMAFKTLSQIFATNQEQVQATRQIRDHLWEKNEAECHQAFRLTKGGFKDDSYEWYKGRVEERVEGTCEWFLRHDNFQTWLEQDTGPLFVSADPGCGKSVLAKYLIDHALPPAVDADICYFFFKDQDQNTLSQALCAVLHQLISYQKALIRHAMPAYLRNGPNMTKNITILWNILQAAVRDPAARPIVVVLDALDECEEDDFRAFMRNLPGLFRGASATPPRIRFLLTSRPYENILSKFQDLIEAFPYIRIPGEDKSDEIAKEVNHVIRHRVQKLGLSTSVATHLTQRLIAVPHRTYLWVYLVFDYMEESGVKNTRRGIDSIIQTLPESVNQAYEKILERHKDPGMVRKALNIILAAIRPLTLAEMNIAVNIELTTSALEDLDLESESDFATTLRRWCGLFVSIYHGRVYFLHQTAREFLLAPVDSEPHAAPPWQHSFALQESHSVLVEACLVYLDTLAPILCSGASDDDPQMVAYSPQGTRSAFLSTEGDDSRDLEHPRTPDHGAFESLISQPYESLEDNTPARSPQMFKVPGVSMTSGSSQTESVERWEVEYRTPAGDDISEVDFSSFNTAMSMTAEARKGASISGSGPPFFAYAAMSWTLHFQEAGVDKDAAILPHALRLCDETSSGHSTWFPKWRGSFRYLMPTMSGLGLASLLGHELLLDRLLAGGADINAKDTYGHVPLHIAAVRGNFGIVRWLLEHNAVVDARDHVGRTPLHKAASNGFLRTVGLLLDDEATIDAMDDYGETPLISAAIGRYTSVVTALIDRGASVESRDSGGRTALHHAVLMGDLDCVTVLVEAGSDLNTNENNGSHLVHSAVGRIEILTQLLDWGAYAHIDFQETLTRRTPLHYAAYFGYEDDVTQLLARGANVNARDADERTPLMLASQNGTMSAMAKLITAGADLAAVGSDGATALHLAAHSDRIHKLNPILLLIKNGADVNAADADGDTTLHVAVASGCGVDLVEPLLEVGANGCARNNKGQTALEIAEEAGYEDLVHLLSQFRQAHQEEPTAVE